MVGRKEIHWPRRQWIYVIRQALFQVKSPQIIYCDGTSLQEEEKNRIGKPASKEKVALASDLGVISESSPLTFV